MHPLVELARSFRGWTAIVGGSNHARDDFRTTRAGFWAAALTLAVAVLLSLTVQSAGAGMPTLFQLLFAVIAQTLTMSLLVLAVIRLLAFLRTGVAPNTLLVPILYVLAFAFIIGIPLMALGPLELLVPVALGALIWRAGMVVADLTALQALGVALLCVIVLVVVPSALYMLLLLIPSA